MAGIDQICFTGESNCTLFRGHMLKPNICTDCMKDISKHARDVVKNDDLVKALEYTQEGERVPSLILAANNDYGGLYLGGFKAATNSDFIKSKDIGAIVNVAGSGLFEVFGRKLKSSYDDVVSSNHLSCLSMDWEDSISQDISDDDFLKVVSFIHEQRRKGRGVLVHCAQGKSRSTTAIVAYLMAMMDYDVDRALSYVQKRRKMAEPNAHFMYLLHKVEKSGLKNELRSKLKLNY